MLVAKQAFNGLTSMVHNGLQMVLTSQPVLQLPAAVA